jgi:hypothetical protein
MGSGEWDFGFRIADLTRVGSRELLVLTLSKVSTFHQDLTGGWGVAGDGKTTEGVGDT